MLRGCSLGLALLLTAAPGIADAAATEHRYEYRMRGEIRFLFFWLGRDAVGGGHIVIRNQGDIGGNRLWEEVEVLFGSNPERVPGKVSRWGYAVERAYYTGGGNGQPVRSEFTGFMRYSPEQSAKEAYSLREGDPSRRFHANSTVVAPERADSEIRFFEEPAGFSYLQADGLISKYFRELQHRPPDVQRAITNVPERYESSQGMLTALLGLTRQILRSERQDGLKLSHTLPRVHYVFNARVYALSVLGVEREGDTIDAEFETHNLEKGTRQKFRLRVPTVGAQAGVPSQILMQPRWWLRLRLDLIGEKP